MLTKTDGLVVTHVEIHVYVHAERCIRRSSEVRLECISFLYFLVSDPPALMWRLCYSRQFSHVVGALSTNLPSAIAVDRASTCNLKFSIQKSARTGACTVRSSLSRYR